jgi:hypothetical protein
MAADGLELLRADIDDHITHRVAEAISGLLQRADLLRGLAKALESACELAHSADGDRLEEAAAGIRALAVEAVTSATGCIGIAERLRAYARLRDLVDPGPTAKELEPGRQEQVKLGDAPPATAADRPRRGRTRGQRKA